MRNIRYIIFCITYWLKHLRIRRNKWGWREQEEGWRLAEVDKWESTIAHRMFDPDGDISIAVEEEKKYKESLTPTGYYKSGEDIFMEYKEDKKDMNQNQIVVEAISENWKGRKLKSIAWEFNEKLEGIRLSFEGDDNEDWQFLIYSERLSCGFGKRMNNVYHSYGRNTSYV